MLQLTPQTQVYIAIEPVDFRRGIDGLKALCKQRLKSDPFSGSLFVFRNKRATAIKILAYDGQGFWLCMKRFSSDKLNWWPTEQSETYRLSASKLQVLLYNGNPMQAGISDDWRQVA